MSGHFVRRIKGDKYRFELQFLKWDFSWDAVAAQDKPYGSKLPGK